MSAKKPSFERKKSTRAVPVGWAVSTIVASLLVSFGLFVSPLHIAIKCYIFMGVCILGAACVGFYPWYNKRAASPSAKLFIVDKISVALVLALVLYTGGVKFVQYWIPGGAEPFFHDMTVAYIAGLMVLILIWAVSLVVSPSDNNFLSVIRSFRYWAFGYIGMFVLMVVMLIVIEGD